MAPGMSVLKVVFEVLKVTALPHHVVHVRLNRPDKLNAFDGRMWRELRECFGMIKRDTSFRAVVLSGEGKHFTAGLDLTSFSEQVSSFEEGEDSANTKIDTARRAYRMRRAILEMQDSFNEIENCDQPVIAAVHGACIGAGIDMITAADIRLCSADAFFSVKEVDVGLAADVGTLQRLPKVVGNQGLVRELAFTGRRFLAPEAQSMGLITHIYPDATQTLDAAIKLATTIASKSPVAVAGTKRILTYSRDHTVAEGLDYVVTWNMSMLQTDDLMEAAVANGEKREPKFSRL